MSDRRTHWNAAYDAKGVGGVSWFQRRPDLSLALIAACEDSKDAAVIDVGGGASTLVDALLDNGFRDLTVLDVSDRALTIARERLGDRATRVHWIESDVTSYEPSRTFAVWHDRAVFHFLTDGKDRERYVNIAHRALQPGGSAVIATFATDGPTRCSGLDVVRYDTVAIAREFGAGFTIDDTREEAHRTPWGAEQRFAYFVLRRQ